MRRESLIDPLTRIDNRKSFDEGIEVALAEARSLAAATGVDAMTHSLESHLSKNPNPFAEAMALAVIRTVAETGSTNADMLELARSGAAEGLWLRAERQTGGKGRQGRVWASPEGNLYVSTLVRVRPGEPPAATLALVAAVALEETVSGSGSSAGAAARNDEDLALQRALGIVRRDFAGVLARGARWAIERGYGDMDDIEGKTFEHENTVQESYAFGVGKAGPGRLYPALYLAGQANGAKGFHRSDDIGHTWVRLNDDAHQLGFVNVIEGDPRAVAGAVRLLISKVV